MLRHKIAGGNERAEGEVAGERGRSDVYSKPGAKGAQRLSDYFKVMLKGGCTLTSENPPPGFDRSGYSLIPPSEEVFEGAQEDPRICRLCGEVKESGHEWTCVDREGFI